MAKTLPTYKRGDAFMLACRFKVNGTPTDITPYTITAQIRDSVGVKLCDLEVTPAADQEANPGVFALSPPINPPTDWPVDLLSCDIQYEQDGLPHSTETMLIPTEGDITHA